MNYVEWHTKVSKYLTLNDNVNLTNLELPLHNHSLTLNSKDNFSDFKIFAPYMLKF